MRGRALNPNFPEPGEKPDSNRVSAVAVRALAVDDGKIGPHLSGRMRIKLTSAARRSSWSGIVRRHLWPLLARFGSEIASASPLIIDHLSTAIPFARSPALKCLGKTRADGKVSIRLTKGHGNFVDLDL